MEHEGIFYFFRHEDGKHTLVHGRPHQRVRRIAPRVRWSTRPGSLAPNHITSWEHQYEFRSGKWTRTDYNFETPSTNLLTTTGTVIDLPGANKYEIFDYPGEYFVKADGEPVTKVRMEEEEAGYDVVERQQAVLHLHPLRQVHARGPRGRRREQRLRDHLDPPLGD